jgi:hypothetical protein
MLLYVDGSKSKHVLELTTFVESILFVGYTNYNNYIPLKSPVIWDITFATFFMLVSCLAYSLTLKIEATRVSETSDDFQQITWSYIPEDRNLYNHRCGNLKSCIVSHY